MPNSRRAWLPTGPGRRGHKERRENPSPRMQEPMPWRRSAQIRNGVHGPKGVDGEMSVIVACLSSQATGGDGPHRVTVFHRLKAATS